MEHKTRWKFFFLQWCHLSYFPWMQHYALVGLGLGSQHPGLWGLDCLQGTPIHTLEFWFQILFQWVQILLSLILLKLFTAAATPGSWALVPSCLPLPWSSSSRVGPSGLGSTGRRCPRPMGIWWGWRILTWQRVPSVAPTHHHAEHTSVFLIQKKLDSRVLKLKYNVMKLEVQ